MPEMSSWYDFHVWPAASSRVTRWLVVLASLSPAAVPGGLSLRMP